MNSLSPKTPEKFDQDDQIIDSNVDMDITEVLHNLSIRTDSLISENSADKSPYF